MQPTAQLLGQLIAIAALLGATIEYIEILRRRRSARRAAAERSASEEAGLRGLVRVLLSGRQLDGS
jgi:hypothetical protein